MKRARVDLLARLERIEQSVYAAVFLPFSLDRQPRADRPAHSVAMPRRTACRDEKVSRVLASLGNQVVVPQTLAIGRGEHGIDPTALVGLAPIIAPCGLSDI